MNAIIPTSLQPVLWSQNVSTLDIEKDKPYIIHQVLNFGDMEHIRWLKKVYPMSDLNDTFINKPMKIYYPSTLNFVKNYLLTLEKHHIDESKYLKSSPRNI